MTAVVALATALSTLAFGDVANAQVPRDDFRKNCSSCHTIGGGPLSGPDLKGVLERAGRDWLVRFVVNPDAVIDSGDPYAAKILREARGVRMPAVAGMTKDRAGALIDLIKTESAAEKSEFAKTAVSDRPLVPEDIVIGRALFTGEKPFKNGGAACVSCHTVGGMSWLGGGQLGPDLTEAYARLEGRKALGAWLSAPATLTMAPIYKAHPIDADEEVLPLVAYLKNATEQNEEPNRSGGLNLLLLGVAGAAALLVLCDLMWKRRFSAVRKPMVGGRS
ncbi:MAG: c-type cytochrome [Planctomycetota bacterium]|jgi:mono/diheme cytochrome c family protein